MRTIRALLKNESGATAIEYALLIAGVSITLMTALQLLGGSIGDLVTRVSTLLAT